MKSSLYYKVIIFIYNYSSAKTKKTSDSSLNEEDKKIFKKLKSISTSSSSIANCSYLYETSMSFTSSSYPNVKISEKMTLLLII